jgi:hypothetical protein
MTLPGVSPRLLGTLTAVGLLALAAHPARVGASEQSYHLTGHVSRIVAPPSAKAGLADLGVKKGAQVDIDWTVELTTPFIDFPQTNTKQYNGALTHIKVQVDSLSDPNKHWIALGMDPPPGHVPLNVVFVGDADSGPLDYMDLKRSCTDSNLLVTGSDPNASSQIGINLAAPNGGASDSNLLGHQDVSLYTANSGFVAGLLANGSPSGVEVDFSIGGPAGPDPTAKCRSSRIASGGVLCQSTFKCLSKHAKAPGNDPNGTVLEACRETARQKFLTAFDKAAATAAKKGLSCRDTAPGPTLVAHFDAAIGAVVDVVDSINPPDDSFTSSAYLAAGTMCGALAKAESKNVTKANSQQLSQARATAHAKLTVAADKAIAKAEKKGVVFDPPPDVDALLHSIDLLINDIVTELNGT